MSKQEELLKRFNKLLVEEPMTLGELAIALGIHKKTILRFMHGKPLFIKPMCMIEKYINGREGKGKIEASFVYIKPKDND